jgi:hypothetical protein
MSGTVAERVAAGAAYLDEHDPEWWREGVRNAISLSRLDLGDGNSCVLGQRCPAERMMRSHLNSPFDVQLRYITRGRGLWAELQPWAAQHGFATDRGCGYWRLTAEWKRIIKARRAGAK